MSNLVVAHPARSLPLMGACLRARAAQVPMVSLLMERYRGLRTRHEAGPLVIFIVAAAVLLALGMTLAAGAAIYCMHKGGSMEWFAHNGWRVWEIKVACRMP